jgi:hypothetical protein
VASPFLVLAAKRFDLFHADDGVIPKLESESQNDEGQNN